MNWLRLPGIEAGELELVHDEAGRLKEVTIPCRPTDTSYPVCCLAQKLVKNGTKAVRYRDRPIERAPTWLVVKRQRVKCHSCGATHYQNVPGMDEHHYITERLRDDVRLSAAKRPFRDVVAMHGVEESLVRRVFRRRAHELLKDYRFKAPRVLGIDENHLFGSARGVVMDLESKRLLDMYPGCRRSHIHEGMTACMTDWGRVELWCQDMAPAYKGLARDFFPKAQIIVDKFHVVMRASRIWNEIRYRETKNLPPEMRKIMPGIIRMFDKRWDKLKRSSQDRVAEVLGANTKMQEAYTIKETFLYFYENATRAEAERAYRDWVKRVADFKQAKEWRPLMNMVQVHREEIFAYFDYRFTSGSVERMNRSIADINRAANGLNFPMLRAKALLLHGTLIEPEDYTYYCMDIAPDDLFPRRPAILSTPNAG